MKIHFFWIPAYGGEQAQAELNRVLSQGRVLQMERHFCATGATPGWAICVELPTVAESSTPNGQSERKIGAWMRARKRPEVVG